MANALNRLLWWHILLIGAGAALILGLILYFAMIKPAGEQVTNVTNTAKSTEDAGGTEEKVAEQTRKLKKAQEDTVRINNDWKVQSASYMPNIDFNKDPNSILATYESVKNVGGVYRVKGKLVGVKDLPSVWGQWISNWYAVQWRDGITPLTSFPIESFSADPNEISRLQSISFPLTKPWNVEVQAKSFDAAMAHLKRFNRMQQHGMPVVDNVALSGQSPDLRVRYNLQVYVIPPTSPPPPDPTINGSGGGGGGGGGPRGPGGFSGPSSMPSSGGKAFGGPSTAEK